MIAKSFARIHRRNLIAQGIVPLLFKDAGRLRQGRARPDVAHLGSAARSPTALDELPCEIDGDQEITLTHDLLPREREIVVAGGLIRYLKQEQTAAA